MKIDKITICNITSFEGEHTIDFNQEPLRSAGLFAITGDTGAGKSSLLDAICLALYNKAPRLESVEKVKKDELQQEDTETEVIRIDDSRNMMRRGAKEAYSIVEFSMPDGTRYEALWQCRLKKTGNFDKVGRSIAQISPKKKIMESGSAARVQQVIDTIVGLDYMQFARTVLLAQGSFATFLQARKKDKSALLEKLTGTEIYARISMKIYELCVAAEAEVKELESRIEGILHDKLSEEQLQDIQTDIHQKSVLMENIGQQIDRARNWLQWIEDHDAARQEADQLEKEYVRAKRMLDEMRTQQLELERYDTVLPIQPVFQEILVRRNDIETLKQQNEQLARRLVECRKEMQEAEKQLNTSKEKTQAAKDKLEEQQPVFNRGYAIIGEITEARQQVSKIELQLEREQVVFSDKQKKYNEKKQEMEHLSAEIQQLKLHEQSLSVHSVMFDRIDLIRDKLVSFRSETEQNQQDKKLENHHLSQQEELREALQKGNQTKQQNEEKHAAYQAELLVHRQANSGRSSEKLQGRASESRNRVLSLTHAASLWQRLVKEYENIEDLRAKVARTGTNLDQLRKDMARCYKEEQVKREVFEHLNQSYLLSNSENIQRLRKHLKEGTACPVCGATHHPYHTETEQELGEVLDKLEKDNAEAKLLWQQKLNELEELQRKLAKDEGELLADRENLQKMETILAADEKEWEHFAHLDSSFKECSSSVNRDARRLMIDMLLDNAQKAVQEAEKELEEFNFHQNSINLLTEKSEELGRRMSEEKTALDDLKTKLQVNQASIETVQQRIRKSDKACEQFYRDLDDMISLSEWFTQWRKNPDNFKQRLNDMSRDWNVTKRKLDELQMNEGIWRNELETSKESVDDAQEKINAVRDDLSAARKKVSGKEEELRNLFGESSPEKEEERLKQYVQECRNEQQQAADKYERLNNEYNLQQGRHHHLEDSRMEKQQAYSRKMQELDSWMLKYNATHSPLQFSELEQIFAPDKNWNAVRALYDERREQLTLAQNNMQAAQNRVAQMEAQPSHPSGKNDESKEAITATLEENRRRHQELTEALTLQRSLVLAHEKSVEDAGDLQQQLEALRQNAEEWRRLNLLLGSADGKKFRELAQSYTLHFLVEQANLQMQQIAPRYRLKNIPGTLVLEIIDRDMFDQSRYVSSLSGGETFVVSLSLALGLAGLSSGSLTIGSLFIDEGFGNLDQESLSLVMDALSNLENSQGRKVGVVSHTEQIRSQISPQIQVRKLPGGGKSCIRVE